MGQVSVDISELQYADYEVFEDGAGEYVATVFYAEAHGVRVSYRVEDPDLDLWISPIWTMREKGVALVDSSGQMVKCERRDR